MIKRLLFAALLLLGLAAPVPVSAADGAAGAGTKTTACDALSQLGTNQDCGGTAATKTVNDTFASITELFSWAVGVVAIIMVVIAGFQYMASGGDSNKVGSAKTTLIYALIGVAVAAVAQLLVATVLKVD